MSGPDPAQGSAPPPPPGEGRDFDLTGIAQRLRQLNPAFSGIRVEPPAKPDAAVRVIIETTRAELASVQGQLHLTDPELTNVKIETSIKFLDQKPGETIKVGLRRNPPGATGPAGDPARRPPAGRRTPPKPPSDG